MKNSKTAYAIGTLLLMAASAGVFGQETQAAESPATPATAPAVVCPPEAEKLLDTLEKRDATLKDFSAQITLTSESARSGEQKIFIGNTGYVKENGIVQLYVRFDVQKDETDAVLDRNLRHEIVFDGRWMIDSDGKNRRFTKQELVPPGKTFNPFKLGEGPLPLPIGQSKSDILRRFVVTLPPPDAATDPKWSPSAVHLRLVPKNERIADAHKMAQLDLWVDPALELPVQVIRTDLGQPASDGSRDTTTITLRDVKINTGEVKIPALPTPKSNDWQVTIEQYRDEY